MKGHKKLKKQRHIKDTIFSREYHIAGSEFDRGIRQVTEYKMREF